MPNKICKGMIKLTNTISEIKVNKGTIMCVTNPDGNQFLVRIVNKGDNYGLKWKLIHEKDEPMVEFYDMDYMHTPYGQFVSRYYMSTLLKEEGYANGTIGLRLDGGVDEWYISANNMRLIHMWLTSKL